MSHPLRIEADMIIYKIRQKSLLVRMECLSKCSQQELAQARLS